MRLNLLTSVERNGLTKAFNIKPDATWSKVKPRLPSFFKKQTIKIDDLRALYDQLGDLLDRPDTCIVNGAFIEDVWEANDGVCWRTLHPTTGWLTLEERKKKKPKTEGRPASIKVRRSNVLALDLDDFTTPDMGDITTSTSLMQVCESVRAQLPPPFNEAECIGMATASYGKPGSNGARIRLFYFNDRAVSLARVGMFLEEKVYQGIDLSTLQPHQPVYTSSPIFKKVNGQGDVIKMRDPVKQRLVMLLGNPLVIDIKTLPTEKEHKRVRVVNEQNRRKLSGLVDVLSEYGFLQGAVGRNQYDLQCPLSHEHSSDDSSGAFLYIDNNSPFLGCTHASHGNGKTNLLREFLSEYDVEARKVGLPHSFERGEKQNLVYPELVDEGGYPDGGEAILTTPNVRWLLEQYGDRFESNVISNDIILRQRGDLWDASMDEYFCYVRDRCVVNGMPASYIQELIRVLGEENQTNPVVDYMEGLKWRGVDVFGQLMKCIVLERESDREYIELVFKKWFIAAVAAADGASHWGVHPDAISKYENVLILVGGQGTKKTTFFRSIVPPVLRSYYKDGVFLDPSNVDSRIAALQNWMVELGEIDSTFKRSDISRLKAFLSEEEDTYRLPYARGPKSYPRHTVFGASVNEIEFLRDQTGNRRYWPVEILYIHIARILQLDMDQLWAQVWSWYIEGESWWLEEGHEANALEEIRKGHEHDPTSDYIEGQTFELLLRNETGNHIWLRSNEMIMYFDNTRAESFEIDLPLGRYCPIQLGKWLAKHNVNGDGKLMRRKVKGSTQWAVPVTPELLKKYPDREVPFDHPILSGV
ncbi:MAG: hypothetical protein KAS32_16990 [Candidatus Peribacteraceae bacterium]|nr:hypothetical protein [Candidatus Peribacteraceae bacterium]